MQSEHEEKDLISGISEEQLEKVKICKLEIKRELKVLKDN